MYYENIINESEFIVNTYKSLHYLSSDVILVDKYEIIPCKIKKGIYSLFIYNRKKINKNIGLHFIKCVINVYYMVL